MDYRERCNIQIDLLNKLLETLYRINDRWKKDEDIGNIYSKGGMCHDDFYNAMKDTEEWVNTCIKNFKKDVVISDIWYLMRQEKERFNDNSLEATETIKECLQVALEEYDNKVKNGIWR